MPQPHRNQSRQFPSPPIVIGQELPITGRVYEHTHTRDLATRVILHWSTGANQPLCPILAFRWPKPFQHRVTRVDISPLNEPKTTQPASRLRRVKIDRAVPWHLSAIGRVHSDLIRPCAPHVGDLATHRRRIDETPCARTECVLTSDRIGMQLQFRATQDPKSKVQHL